MGERKNLGGDTEEKSAPGTYIPFSVSVKQSGLRCSLPELCFHQVIAGEHKMKQVLKGEWVTDCYCILYFIN